MKFPYKILKKEKRKYPVCPECGQHTIVLFSPPHRGKDGKVLCPDKFFKDPQGYVDWHEAHIYCCNGSTNCQINTKIIELTTPLTEKK